MATDEADFEQFCRDLDALKGKASVRRMRATFTRDVLAAIHRQAQPPRPRRVVVLGPLVLVGAASALWLCLLQPLGFVTASKMRLSNMERR